jgi:hypothetical protein
LALTFSKPDLDPPILPDFIHRTVDNYVCQPTAVWRIGNLIELCMLKLGGEIVVKHLVFLGGEIAQQKPFFG